MAQRKQQKKTPQKELNEMKITNLSDVEFKTLVISMIKELIEYSNKIKKTQEDMKVTLSEIKKNIHETNNWRDEAGIQIYSLEHKE